MNKYEQQWQRLTAAARRISEGDAPVAPMGFATRVAALAAATPRRRLEDLFGRFALRALAGAAALSIAAVVFSVSTMSDTRDDDGLLDETVTQMLDVS